MLEVFNIIINPEILLSLVVLCLVLHGIRLPILKLSVIVLFLIGIITGFNLAGLDSFETITIIKYSYITNGLLDTNNWIIISKFIIIIGSISILLMGISETILIKSYQYFSLLILILTLGALLLVSSINWLSIYLVIELQTLILFILTALKRDSAYGTEAALKYFILGALSSSLFLFGCGLLYGLVGETSVQGINSILTIDVGKILITISLLFKLAAAPFHMWAPDVYEGAPTIITALLATVPKVGIFSILVQIGPVINVILISAVLSIIYGAIGALNQTKIKRLLAYSGIGHMGFILLGVAIDTFESIQASLIYIIIYIIITICSFTIILSLNLTKNLIIEISGLSGDNPVIAATLALTLFSVAGIPPLAGFLSKLLILLSGVLNGYYLITIIAVISSVIAGVYYVRLVHLIYFPINYSILIWQNILIKQRNINLSKSILIGITFYIILFLIITPNFLLQISHNAVISLY
uniref:NADH:ubiquinone reductase (H(+)-translocating) n=1 Tax=Ptilocaulis walpersi TaxID=479640 RepID=I6LIL2_9METZ|nr:NADH dehydrogenase subunit 2 [Ptilocaulis walpersi]ABW83893.1 NADH dehydrogenase subunit 2 [Ptilocaulis walpersi]